MKSKNKIGIGGKHDANLSVIDGKNTGKTVVEIVDTGKLKTVRKNNRRCLEIEKMSMDEIKTRKKKFMEHYGLLDVVELDNLYTRSLCVLGELRKELKSTNLKISVRRGIKKKIRNQKFFNEQLYNLLIEKKNNKKSPDNIFFNQMPILIDDPIAEMKNPTEKYRIKALKSEKDRYNIDGFIKAEEYIYNKKSKIDNFIDNSIEQIKTSWQKMILYNKALSIAISKRENYICGENLGREIKKLEAMHDNVEKELLLLAEPLLLMEYMLKSSAEKKEKIELEKRKTSFISKKRCEIGDDEITQTGRFSNFGDSFVILSKK